MPPSFGPQPAIEILQQQRWTVSAAAREIGVKRAHLNGVIHGYVTPSLVVREQLPKLLNRPLTDLFNEDFLKLPIRYRRGDRFVHYRQASVR